MHEGEPIYDTRDGQWLIGTLFRFSDGAWWWRHVNGWSSPRAYDTKAQARRALRRYHSK